MSSEIELYRERLRDLRAKVLKNLEGLDADALNWTPLAHATNSLFVLATHVNGSEHGWIFETLHQGSKTRNRAAEFEARGEAMTALRAQFDATARETEKILEDLSIKDLEETRQGLGVRHGSRVMTVREIILHVIEHYSEHIGAMELTRQLWENR
jgi:uncharacterized damage-inducible protein DinB